MSVASFVLMLTKLVLGAVATFLAILVWSRTREAAWVLVVAGVLATYVGIVYNTLELFGIISPQAFTVSGLPLGTLVVQNLPVLFFVAAFAVFLLRRRRR
jgi:hypothetical protein